MYVLDTNTLIYFFKGQGGVADSMFMHPPEKIGIPAIVLYELELGIAKSSAPRKRRTQLQELTSVVDVLAFGSREATEAAKIRARLEQQGTPIGPHDVLIAGTAMARQGTLVTNNEKEFRRVKGLRLENWFR